MRYNYSTGNSDSFTNNKTKSKIDKSFLSNTFKPLQLDTQNWCVEKAEVAKIRDKMKSDLGSKEYFRFCELFYHVCVDEYDYKILITRRAYLLYKLFLDIFKYLVNETEDYSKKFKIYGEFYNNHSMCLLKEILKDSKNRNKKILIVDDIIVHGRAVSNICKILTDYGALKNHISIWSFLLNSDANCLEPYVKAQLKTYKYSSERQWKVTSDVFTDAIINYGRGYTSYVNTYLLRDNSDLFERIKNFLKNKKEQVINKRALRNNEVETYYYFPKINSDSIKYNIHELACLRFYFYENHLLIIPYLFVESIKLTDVFDYSLELLSKYNIYEIPKIFEDARIKKNTDLAILLLKWTINRIGKEVLDSFFTENFNIKPDMIENEFPETYKNCDSMSEIKMYHNNEEKKSYEVLSSNEGIDYCYEVFSKETDKITTNQFNDSNNEIKYELLHDAFAQYCFLIKEEDEKRAKNRKQRCIGIRVSDIRKIVFQKLNLDINNNYYILLIILSLCINSWDSGKTSYNIYSFDNTNHEKIVCGFMRNGEQIFKSLYEQFPKIYSYYYVFTAKTLEIRKSELLEFGEYLVDNLTGTDKDDANKFYENMKMNNSYDNDVFVVKPKNIEKKTVEFVQNYISSMYK